MQSPDAFARDWYNPASIRHTISRNAGSDIPTDHDSDEFATWLCGEYRLAMAKGIEIGRQQELDRQRALKELTAQSDRMGLGY